MSDRQPALYPWCWDCQAAHPPGGCEERSAEDYRRRDAHERLDRTLFMLRRRDGRPHR